NDGQRTDIPRDRRAEHCEGRCGLLEQDGSDRVANRSRIFAVTMLPQCFHDGRERLYQIPTIPQVSVIYLKMATPEGLEPSTC
ncbi:MAG: hypothetical protein AAFR10_21610, partial [Pseudomonadota bacterium]